MKMFCLLLAAWTGGAHGLHALQVQSPDGNLTATVALQTFEGHNHCPVYTILYKGQTIVGESGLGLEIEKTPLRSGLQIVRHDVEAHDSSWEPVYGERKHVRDHYNQLVVVLRETDPRQRTLQLSFRAYNQGIAFCYTIPPQAGLERVTINRELTEFRFPADHTAWATYSAQGKYSEVRLSQIKPGCERPLTLQISPDRFLALAEARLVDYARMKFAPLPNRPQALVSDLSSAVESGLPLRTPWRVVMVAEQPGQLLENNDLLLNLNDPCAIPDTSWIKPGKVIREVTLTTAGGKACVDFAVKHSLQYVEFDAGWYGPENSETADARTVTLDPKRSRGPLDLPEVIRYAEARGIGIILYVNRRALESQLDEILPLYRQWGVRGVKYGFVNVGSQRWTQWLHEAVRKAADHQLMVDVHDEYRPTGYSRTYPNLMTQEGIAGDETKPVNSQTLTLLFTRMLAGAGDHTICYYDRRVDDNATHAFQLAKAVCFYSPWQFLFWYDRPVGTPEKVGGAETGIGTEPELEFFDHMPTVWEDTRVIHGRIGRYAVLARRRGENWFVGCMNSDGARALEVPLDFLEPARPYVAHLYADDANVPTRTRVRVDRYRVDANTVLRVVLSSQGGQAIRLVPATPEDMLPPY